MTHPTPLPGSDADFALAHRAVERGWLTREQVEAAIVARDKYPTTRLYDHLPLSPEQRRELEAPTRVPPEVLDAMKDPSKRVGRYWMVNLLGRGGMGMVFRGWDADLGRWVALKFLKQIGDEQARAYFRREAHLAASLEHPNIAKIYDIGEREGAPFIAMQLVEGETLAAAKLKLEEKLEAVRRIAEAVKFAHERNVIHRDLKPANVMIDTGKQIYVMDFGLAKETALEGESLTGTNVVVGTPNYMAPEQARGRATAQSDVYSIGAILYDLVCGRPPFVGDSAADVLMQVVTAELVWPRKLAPGTSADVEAIILKALEKDPKRRYASAAQLIEDLEAYRHGEPLRHGRRATWSYRLGKRLRKQPLLWAAVATAIAAMVGGAAFGTTQLVRARKSAEEKARVEREERVRTSAALERAEKGEREARESESRANVREWESRLEAARALYERSFGLSEQGRHQAAAACLLRAVEIASPGQAPEGVRRTWDDSGWAEEAWRRFRYLDIARVHALRSFSTPGFRVTSLALSPDGKRLATTSSDRWIRLWDVETRSEILRFGAHRSDYRCVAFSPDGRIVAAGTRDAIVRSWDGATGRLLREIAHGGTVTDIAFLPDGRLLSGSEGGDLRLLDLRAGETLLRLDGGGGSIRCVACSPDGRIAATAAKDGTARLWDLSNGTEVRRCEGGRILSVCFDSEGKRLLTGSEDGTVRLCETSTGREILRLRGHKWDVHAVGFSPDGELAVSAAGDDTIRVWDLASAAEAHRIETRWNFLPSMALSPDGSWIVGGEGVTALRTWRLPPPHEAGRLPAGSKALGILALHPDGTIGAGGSEDGDIVLWEMATGRELGRLQGHKKGILALAFRPDGRTLASASQDRSMRVWDVVHRKEIRCDEDARVVAFAKDGRLALCDRPRWRMVDVDSGNILWESLQSTQYGTATFRLSPDGMRLMSVPSHGYAVRVYDLRRKEKAQDGGDVFAGGMLVGHMERILSAAFSPDGNMAITGSSDRTARIWDLSTMEEVRRLPHSESVNAVSWSFDPGIVATAVAPDEFRLWDATTGKCLRTFFAEGGEGFGRRVPFLEFGPGGRILLGPPLELSGQVAIPRWTLLDARVPHEPPRIHAEDPDDPYWAFRRHSASVGLAVVREGPARGEIQPCEGLEGVQDDRIDRLIRDLHEGSEPRRRAAAVALRAYGGSALGLLVERATPEARLVERAIRLPEGARAALDRLRLHQIRISFADAPVVKVLELLARLTGARWRSDGVTRIAGSVSVECGDESGDLVLEKTLKPPGYLAVPLADGTIMITSATSPRNPVAAMAPLRLPVTPPEGLEKLISDLGDPSIEVREAASRSLLHPGAEDALWRALDSRDPEAAARALAILVRFYTLPGPDDAGAEFDAVVPKEFLENKQMPPLLRKLKELSGPAFFASPGVSAQEVDLRGMTTLTARDVLRELGWRNGVRCTIARGKVFLDMDDEGVPVARTAVPPGPLLWVRAGLAPMLSTLILRVARGGDDAAHSLLELGVDAIVPMRYAAGVLGPHEGSRLRALVDEILWRSAGRYRFVDEPPSTWARLLLRRMRW